MKLRVATLFFSDYSSGSIGAFAQVGMGITFAVFSRRFRHQLLVG
jgi:hypothetical protein